MLFLSQRMMDVLGCCGHWVRQILLPHWKLFILMEIPNSHKTRLKTSGLISISHSIHFCKKVEWCMTLMVILKIWMSSIFTNHSLFITALCIINNISHICHVHLSLAPVAMSGYNQIINAMDLFSLSHVQFTVHKMYKWCNSDATTISYCR